MRHGLTGAEIATVEGLGVSDGHAGRVTLPAGEVLKGGSLECVGFYSASKVFEKRAEALDYLSGTIGAEVKVFLGKEPMMNVVGKAEFSCIYEKDGLKRELRFKPFSIDGGEKSVILCFHGLPRDGRKSMEREFAGFWQYVTKIRHGQ